jgi:hypothetical protein
MRKRNTAASADDAAAQAAPDAAAPASEAAGGNGAGAARSPRRGGQQAGGARGAGGAGGRRRGPRKGTPGSETGVLIEALLRSRGARGAAQEDLQRVIQWAQGIRAEGAAIAAAAAESRRRSPRNAAAGGGAGRGRASAATLARQKEERQRELAERTARHEMDQALLDGVLAGRIALDVATDGGRLVFLQGGQAPAVAGAGPASGGETAASA